MLEKILKEKIAAQGSISVAEYMQDCLYHPDYGYYMTNNPFGEKGDFTTAPEISQMFGELLGAWVVDSWQKLGSPDAFKLIEGGPGRGVLMADMLRTLQKVAPDCYAAANVTMLEISPSLIEIQMKNLAEYSNIYWAIDINDIDLNEPTIFIGNEFLDAFPIQQFVDGEEQQIINDGKIKFKLNGDITETSPSQDEFLRTLKNKVNNCIALFIDYGSEGSADTLQALMNNKKVDVLTNFGKADLTAHVNFAKVKDILGEQNCSYTKMGQFLINLGLPIRAAKLLDNSDTPEEKLDIEQAAYRLLHPSQMGSLFKVLCWSSNGVKVSGF